MAYGKNNTKKAPQRETTPPALIAWHVMNTPRQISELMKLGQGTTRPTCVAAREWEKRCRLSGFGAGLGEAAPETNLHSERSCKHRLNPFPCSCAK